MTGRQRRSVVADRALGATLAGHIRTIPDYPKPGVQFRDISTLIAHAGALRLAVEGLCSAFPEARPDLVTGIEARGFIPAGAVAVALGTGLVLVRKAGKLPAAALAVDYQLEYGSGTLEIHRDAIAPGQRVLLVDDLVATGGTILAAIDLLEQLQARPVGVAALVDLPDLGGSERILARGVPVRALTEFGGA